MNRDPNRIDIMIEVLRAVWKQTPNKRLGQLLVDIDTRSDVPNLYMLTDERFLKVLENLHEENAVRKAQEDLLNKKFRS